MSDLHELFSKNRSEELQEDNWSNFVVPPFFENLGIKSQSKALAIVGGRGCGKTALLRYFCYQSQFSEKRGALPPDALQHIGLYWRADTNFLNAFVGSDLPERTWRSAFEHVLSCDLGVELIDSILHLNCNDHRKKAYGQLEDVTFDELLDFDEDLSENIYSLREDLRKRSRQLSSWVNNIETRQKPCFLPFPAFLETMVDIVRRQLSYLEESNFAVFIDEYENMREEQQKLINGFLKHGKPPLLFNIAMKRNGLSVPNTVGPESIQQISDYREVDLELELDDQRFELFAAELLFFRLSERAGDKPLNLPIDRDELRDTTRVGERYQSSIYRKRVVSAAEEMLPRVSPGDAAREIVQTPALTKRLRARVERALKDRRSELAPSDFFSTDHPEASVVVSALLHRDGEDLQKLLSEFQNLKSGKSSRLEASGDLIGNNLFGVTNAIFIDSQHESVLFSGFKTLALVSRRNIRHALELSHGIFKEFEVSHDSGGNFVVPPMVQARAMRLASERILDDISGGCGKYGPQLQNLAKSLGSLFRIMHRSDRQSEPETNHFTLSQGEQNQELSILLKEAIKWSVLYQQKETKMKSVGAADADYVLNPIFSPFYQISYRKKRSTQLTTRDLLTMLTGDQQARDALIRSLTTTRTDLRRTDDLFSEH